jgi:UDP:flavonoid glycosyltransferase YjiC (YdhE family)
MTKFIDNQAELIVVSFGTAYIHKNETMRAVLNFAIKHDEYGFVIAFPEGDRKYFEQDILTMTDGYEHIKMMGFIPQQSLLHHNKTKLFINHGGYNGFLECVEARVPMMIIPTYALDQLQNCEVVQKNQYG